MEVAKTLDYVTGVLENMPPDWLRLTTHRLDIYNEKLAKTEFIDRFNSLFLENNFNSAVLGELPTAYDYIRLGHPLSCILEWTIARLNSLKPAAVLSFSSKTAPMLAVLRRNLLDGVNTQISYVEDLPDYIDTEALIKVYGYQFTLNKVSDIREVADFPGSNIFISQRDHISTIDPTKEIDFYLNIHDKLGSVVMVNGAKNERFISEIQHFRRRETIAMTPDNCWSALKALTEQSSLEKNAQNASHNKAIVLKSINAVTGTFGKPIVASSGLSIQYAIMMGLVDNAFEKHKGKDIKFIVPPNCYGGTNDQARRVAACFDNVEVVDLHVDGDSEMVRSLDAILCKIAERDEIPFIIAEIPTNPRVEVPDLFKLKEVLSRMRLTNEGECAIDPVFILDQTFCPNVHFLGEGKKLSSMRAISYVSGSKFPSGGLCTAGYCVANEKTESLIEKIERHLILCDNEATEKQYEILAHQLPSMKQRIQEAYNNTREFVNYVQETLPTAKINFLSEELASEGITPSVFSMELPTKGKTDEEKENYRRALNLRLIDLMIKRIPNESKYVVSYGQLKGCYWTIPATSTQGTTKEGDKDYIVRVALSPDMDLELHKKVFLEFVEGI